MNKKTFAVRALIGVVVVAALAWFASANSGQSVDVRFGLFTLRGVSLPVVIYGAAIIGMLLMVAVSLRNDLRTRQALDHYDKIAADVLGSINADEDEEEVLEEAGGKS